MAEDPSPSGNPGSNGEPRPAGKPPRGRPFTPAGWVVGLLLAMTLLLIVQQFQAAMDEVTYSVFRGEVLAGNVAEARVDGRRVYGKFREAPTVSADGKVIARGDTEIAEADAEPAEENTAVDNKADDERKEQETGDESGGDEDAETAPEEAETTDTGTADDDATTKGADAKKPDRKISQDFYVVIPGAFDSTLRTELDENGVLIKGTEPVDWGGLLTLIWFGVLIALAIMMFSFFRRTRDQMMGGGMLGNVTKQPGPTVRARTTTGQKITFDDVAGLKGVKSRPQGDRRVPAVNRRSSRSWAPVSPRACC